MKQLTEKNKIFYIISLLIIIIGIIVVISQGFNVGLEYKPYQKVEISIEKEFDIKDVKNITEEVFGKEEVQVKKIELFDDIVSISTSTISEEQKDNLVQKINEKYELSKESSSINIVFVPNVKLTDLFKKYIYPMALSFVIIIVYMLIRYIKIGSLKTVIEAIVKIVMIELLILSLFAITRISVGIFTIPLLLIGYVLTTVCLVNKFEKQLSQKKDEEGKNIKE